MRKKSTLPGTHNLFMGIGTNHSCICPNQNHSGIISDQTGVPLLKATIKDKGQKISTVSDANGQFKLVVPEGATELDISYVGMKPTTVSIASKETVLVTLNVTESKLNEGVVIGY